MVFQTAIFSVVWKGFHICLSLLFWLVNCSTLIQM